MKLAFGSGGLIAAEMLKHEDCQDGLSVMKVVLGMYQSIHDSLSYQTERTKHVWASALSKTTGYQSNPEYHAMLFKRPRQRLIVKVPPMSCRLLESDHTLQASQGNQSIIQAHRDPNRLVLLVPCEYQIPLEIDNHTTFPVGACCYAEQRRAVRSVRFP